MNRIPLHINPVSRRLLDSALDGQFHAVIISAPRGHGLLRVAKAYTSQQKHDIVVVEPTDPDDKIDYEKGSIRIKQIRELHNLIHTKRRSGFTVIINRAEYLSRASQVAMLKMLEEPNAHVRFILLSYDTSNIMPTVWSRSHQIALQPITPDQSEQLLDECKITDPTKRTQLLYIANGLPATLVCLARDEAKFTERVSILKDAKKILQDTAYEALKIAHKYKDDRAAAQTLVSDALAMIRALLSQKPSTTLLSKLRAYEEAYGRLLQNGNVRVILTTLVV